MDETITGDVPAPSQESQKRQSLAGTSISHFEITSLLGEGGMGQVYHAVDTNLGRSVALKMLPVDSTDAEDRIRRFAQEACAASALNHPNIITIYEVGHTEALHFIAMEHIDGVTLRHRMAHNQISTVEAVETALQVGNALEAAHSVGIVHRDIKPENIMVRKDGYIKVLDFGLAKLLNSLAAGPQDGTLLMTEPGIVMGTVTYISPEQARGLDVDARTDIWSFGVVLYEMLAGSAPFRGATAGDIFAAILNKEPPALKRDKNLPPELERIVFKALEKDRDKRYQTVKELLDDLRIVKTRLDRAAEPRHLVISEELRRLRLSAGLPATLRHTRPVVRFSIGGALLLAVVTSSLLYFWPGLWTNLTPAKNIPVKGRHVAVLPFRVSGDESSLNYIADELADGLSARLGKFKDISIASSDEVDGAMKKGSLEEIVHELGVDLLVHGTVQGNASEMHVLAQLENVAQGKLLWTQEYSGSQAELLNMEDQINSKLVAVLGLGVTDQQRAQAPAQRPTKNIDAWNLYLKGKEALRRQRTAKDFEATIQLFSEAIKTDPDFALAYALLADTYVVVYRRKKDTYSFEQAQYAAEEAQRLDDNLAEAHFALGSVFNLAGKLDDAIAEFKRAQELSPATDQGYRRMGKAYQDQGRKEDAVESFNKAIELNPDYYNNYFQLGEVYVTFEDYSKAFEAYNHAIQLQPDYAAAYDNIGLVYFKQRKWTEAVPEFKKALELQPDDDNIHSNLGTALFYLKRYDEAIRSFQKAVELNPTNEVWVGNLADTYRWNGQKEKAKATYDKAIVLATALLQVNPHAADTLGDLALYNARKGNPIMGLEYIRRARSGDRTNNDLRYYEAEVQAFAGHTDEAVRILKEALDKGYSVELETIKGDPELQPLRDSPEYQKLSVDFSGKT